MPEDGCHTTFLVLLSLCDTQCHFFPLQMQISPHLSRLLSSFDPLIRSALPWLPQICPGQALHAGPSLSPQAQRVQDDACVDKPSRLPSMGNGEIYGGEKKIENRKIQEFDASHRLCRWCQKFPVWVQRTIVSFRLELCLSRVNSFKVRLQ